MVRYWVLIYIPNEKSYSTAGFTTSQVSHSLKTLQDKTGDSDSEVLRSLNEVRAHDLFAAVVPGEFAAYFAHQFVNYATSEAHKANIGIAIRVYSEQTDVTYEIDWNNPLPLSEIDTLKHHSIATLKLFKCQFVSFAAADGETYTVSFKVTAGDKLILGAEPGTNGDWQVRSQRDINPRSRRYHPY